MPRKVEFDGFSIPERQRLIAAFSVMKAASAKAKDTLMSGNLAIYTKWFGGNAHLMKVASIVKEIDDAINERSITFANATGNSIERKSGGLCGYVWLIANQGTGDAFSKAVHVGSGLRVLIVPKTHNGSITDLAETMYHELSHKIGGTIDVTYDVDMCLSNARLMPSQAALNAENYNRFLGDFIN